MKTKGRALQPDRTGKRAIIPPWLANKEMVGPCPCGQPPDPEVGYIIVTERTTELKRWFHGPCWYMFTGGDPDGDGEDEY